MDLDSPAARPHVEDVRVIAHPVAADGTAGSEQGGGPLRRAARLAFWWVALGCSAACGGSGPARQDVREYAVHAGGRPAIVDGATPLSWPQNEFSGLILNAELCDGRAYLFAPSVKSVQVADLATQRVDGRIGRPGNGPGNLRRPVSMGIDCRNQKVYCVEGPGGILSFDLKTGEYLTTNSHPLEFRASMGSRISVSEDGTRLFLPGLWPAERGSFDRQSRVRMYADTNLGMALSLTSGTSKPMTAAIERGCKADSSACLRVAVEPLSGWSGWAVGQGGGTRIAVFSAAGALLRTIDVRSPGFLRDTSSPGDKAATQIKWGETNSSIWAVYVLRDIIAVIHARHATKNWKRGQVVQFDVLMNLYSAMGERLVSDIHLPDLPVGHDDTHILVIDYGPAGRRSNAGEVRLLRVRVRPGTEGFASE